MNGPVVTPTDGQDEIVTGSLNPDQILEQLGKAVLLLLSVGVEKVVVEFGWGSNLDTADLWKSIEVELLMLEGFVKEAEQRGIYRLGSADLVVADDSGAFQIVFCHESDIHFKATDSALMRAMRNLWMGQGIEVMRKTASGEWTPT